MSNEGWVSGDHWKICDVCGFRVRASETRKRWDGAIVCDQDYETRHPQEMVRGRHDRQIVSNPRPEPTDTFLTANQVTADSL